MRICAIDCGRARARAREGTINNAFLLLKKTRDITVCDYFAKGVIIVGYKTNIILIF